MNIYKVEQNINNDYDTYDSFVCIAETEQDARLMHPSEFVTHHRDGNWYGTSVSGIEYEQDNYDWVKFDKIYTLTVTHIGTANKDQKSGIILASFNAG